jgi:prepilin-type N-terminal cleavage/methylation domain-containing protein
MKTVQLMKANRQSGFTLMELMITLAIITITMTIAVPNMSTFIKNDRLTSSSNALLSDLLLAKSKAAELNQPAIVCASNNATSCTDGDYQDGWIVAVDTNVDGTVTADDELIKVQPALTGDIEYVLGNAGMSTIVFDTRGFTPNSIGTISTCDTRGNSYAKTLTLNRLGRASRGATPAC